MEKDFDVIIIGGGPGGISSAIWCHELGLSCLLLDSESRLGGQLLSVHNPVKNYPGLVAENGTEIRDLFIRSLEGRRSVILKNPITVKSIEIAVDGQAIQVFSVNESFRSKVLIYAAGVRRRKLGIPGEENFFGRGVLRSAALEFEKATDKIAMVVGGGDAAFENAIILSKVSSKVYLVHRRDSFTARPEFVERVRDTQNITLLSNYVVESLSGTDRLDLAVIKNTQNSHSETIPIDNIIFRLGVVPNTEMLIDKVELDDQNYVKVDSNCRSSFPGIYAVGDVANPVSPTIATAVGMGATAAKSAYQMITDHTS